MAKQIFRNDLERAVAYAGQKALERLTTQDGTLPPGFYQDISGITVTITFPPGTVVERDKGTNGDGTIFKRATTKLYGFALWALLIKRLRVFHQWAAIRQIIVDCMAEVMRGSTIEQELNEVDPDLEVEIQHLREQFPVPPRCEETPRVCKETKLPPTLTFRFPGHRQQ